MTDLHSFLTPLIESLSDGVLVYDRSKNLLAANSRARALFPDGRPRLTLGDLSLDVVLHRVLAGDEATVQATARDGRPGCHVAVHAARLELARDVPAVSVRLREQRHAAPVGDESSASVRHALLARVLPGVTHDLRGPLTTISGVAQVLATDTTLTDDVREHLQLVFSQVEHADALLRELSSLGRDPRHDEYLPVALGDAARQAISLLSYELKVSHIDVDCDIEPDVPLLAWTPDQLRVLAVALLVAAIDSTSEMRSRRLHVTVKRGPGDVARLEVGGDLDHRPESLMAACSLAQAGAGVVRFERSGDSTRLVAELTGIAAAAPSRGLGTRILAADNDLDHLLACLHDGRRHAADLTLASSAEVAARALETGESEAALLDLEIAAIVEDRPLPDVTIITAPPSRAAQAKRLAERLGVNWAPKASALTELWAQLARSSGRNQAGSPSTSSET